MKENEIIDTKEIRLVSDIRTIVEQGLQTAYQSVNTVIVLTYWQVGRRIVEEEQNGEVRAEYGSKLITLLAEALSTEYARGFSARDLRNYRQLYLCFNDLEIWYTRVPNLTWSHYRTLLSVTSDDARYWYVQEASREMWSVRTLARNVGSQYYHRFVAVCRNQRRHRPLLGTSRQQTVVSGKISHIHAIRRRTAPRD